MDTKPITYYVAAKDRLPWLSAFDQEVGWLAHIQPADDDLDNERDYVAAHLAAIRQADILVAVMDSSAAIAEIAYAKGLLDAGHSLSIFVVSNGYLGQLWFPYEMATKIWKEKYGDVPLVEIFRYLFFVDSELAQYQHTQADYNRQALAFPSAQVRSEVDSRIHLAHRDAPHAPVEYIMLKALTGMEVAAHRSQTSASPDHIGHLRAFLSLETFNRKHFLSYVKYTLDVAEMHRAGEASRPARSADGPTDKQVKFLRSLGYSGPEPKTKKEASDLIGKYKNS